MNLDGNCLPSFLVPDPSTLKLTVSATNVLMAGTYNLRLKGSLNPYIYSVFDFTLEVIPYPKPPPPKFLANIKTIIFLNLGGKIAYKLPAPYNPFNNEMTIKATSPGSSTLPSFIQFDNTTTTINFNALNPSDVGDHQLQVSLTEKDPLYLQTRIYLITVEVHNIGSEQTQDLISLMAGQVKVTLGVLYCSASAS